MYPQVPPIAVLLGMGPTALAAARTLGRRQIPVYGFGLSECEVTFSSRYCQRAGAADPRKEPERLCRLLIEFARANPAAPKILYPTGDECVAFMSEHDACLREYYTYSDVSPATVQTFLDKRHFHRLCLDCGVPTARSYFPETPEAALDLKQVVQYPCILKPAHIHLWAEEFGLNKGFLCRDQHEYAANIGLLHGVWANLFVQEVIEGPESNLTTCIFYMDRTGVPHGLFTGRKIRQYPYQFGTGSAVLSTNETEIIEPSLGLLRQAGYYGMAEVEFKWCPRDRIHKVIEVNIRTCRLGSLVEACGVNPLYASFLDLSGSSPPPDAPQARDVAWFFLMRDLPAAILGLRSGRLRLADISRSYAHRRVGCIYAKDDPAPALAYFREMTSKGFAQIGHALARRRIAHAR